MNCHAQKINISTLFSVTWYMYSHKMCLQTSLLFTTHEPVTVLVMTSEVKAMYVIVFRYQDQFLSVQSY